MKGHVFSYVAVKAVRQLPCRFSCINLAVGNQITCKDASGLQASFSLHFFSLVVGKWAILHKVPYT